MDSLRPTRQINTQSIIHESRCCLPFLRDVERASSIATALIAVACLASPNLYIGAFIGYFRPPTRDEEHLEPEQRCRSILNIAKNAFAIGFCGLAQTHFFQKYTNIHLCGMLDNASPAGKAALIVGQIALLSFHHLIALDVAHRSFQIVRKTLG